MAARGIPWNVKGFCKSCQRAYKADGSPNSSKISTSLKQLEIKKRLVQCYGQRTSHVKLTERGRTQARARRDDPRTWQEKRAAEQARRRAHAIADERYRYEDQMSKIHWYICWAREAYYLRKLYFLGQMSSYEERNLEITLCKLRCAEFKRLMPVIFQSSTLPQDYIQEVREIQKELLQ